MKVLIVEDDPVSQVLIRNILADYGVCHLATDGREAVELVKTAIEEGEPYDLICLDLMLPVIDGHDLLRKIRELEENYGLFPRRASKVVVITVLSNIKNVSLAYKNLCDAYLTKPIDKNKLLEELKKLNLIN